MRIYGDKRSGNCYKIQLLLSLLGKSCEWVDVDIMKGETRGPSFLEKTPNGKIPLLELDDGRVLSESNAIMHYIACNSPYLPSSPYHFSQLLQWQFFEHLNNDHGLLTFCVSRNHRSSNVWAMLDWIVKNGPGSYGLFYCHDDEDSMDRFAFGRQPPMDYDNVYQVHRLLNGRITELNDPFFGLIEGSIDPVHPYNRATHDE